MTGNDVQLYIKLLEEQIAALRSVISELSDDPNCYTQFRKAEAIAEVLLHLVRP